MKQKNIEIQKEYVCERESEVYILKKEEKRETNNG